MRVARANLPSRVADTSVYDSFVLAVFAVVLVMLLIAVPTSEQPLPVVAGLLVVFAAIAALLAPPEKSILLLLPVILSAGQNLYLGALAPDMNAAQLSALLVANFMIAIGLLGSAIFNPSRKGEAFNQALVILIATGAYGVMTVGMFGGTFDTALASMRNLLNPALFFCVGAGFAASASLPKFLRLGAALAVVVAVFGAWEQLVHPEFWAENHVAALWELKGLPINPDTGLPGNFYSSETVGGEQLRRMTSSFADPVNLGTFLFFGFAAAWYVRWRLAALVIVLAIVLTVSKGAILGLLIFAVIRSRQPGLPELRFVVTAIVTVIGVAFVGYSLTNSSQSLFAHFDGFTSAFKGLPSAPFGHGVGQVGVLALVAGTSQDATITESGVGAIVGQLGAFGLGLFIWLIVVLRRNTKDLPGREAILGTTLLVSIIANIAFNEIALSPNSSAAYFLTLGLLAGRRQLSQGGLLSSAKEETEEQRVLGALDRRGWFAPPRLVHAGRPRATERNW